MFTCSPIGARRVKTDLQTSELKNVFIEQRTSNCALSVVNSGGVLNKKSSPVLGNARKSSSVATNTSPQKIRWRFFIESLFLFIKSLSRLLDYFFKR